MKGAVDVMAAQEIPRKQAAAVMLSINERDKAVSLGTLDVERWDADKALAIAGALVGCLDGQFSWVRHVPTMAVQDE